MPTAAGSIASEMTLPADLATRFAAALARLLPTRGRIGLAVSGGADSLAMLLLAEQAIPGCFEVATVDHGLRREAAAECALVEDLCRKRGISCSILRVAVGPGNLQAEARQARYAALAGWAARRDLAAIATAHHIDDQAETLLMRLNRASGVAGLAGVRERGTVPGSGVPLLRPLLDMRRAELAGIVQAAGIEPASDPSNADPRYDRVRLRQALAAADFLDPAAIAISARHLADAEEALAWAAAREWAEQVTLADGTIRYTPAAPRAIVLRVVERAVAMLGAPARGGDVARLIDRLEAGGAGNVAGVHAQASAGSWVFRPEPPRRTG